MADRNLPPGCYTDGSGNVVCPTQKFGMMDLRSPHSGAPLEPPSMPGNSVLFSPYDGHFVAVSMPGNAIVTPRYAQLEQGSIDVVKKRLHEAGNILRKDNSDKAVEKAFSIFNAAARVNPSIHYPNSGIDKNVTFLELKEDANMVDNFMTSARNSKGNEKAHWYQRARERMLTAETVLT